MIEIVNTHNLKNITQIGTPGSDEEKIYIEDSVYTRIHIDEFRDKRVFVFMGHTECADGKYKTFIEGVIPVYDIEFREGIPVWNNHSWSEVFREIKRNYTDSIIVGWAFDQRGTKPSATAELEAIHREHFGGIHQLLFLMDTTAGDEAFFILRSNRLYPKSGFYIFYSGVKTPVPEPVDLEVEWIKQNSSSTRRVSSQPRRVSLTPSQEEYSTRRVSAAPPQEEYQPRRASATQEEYQPRRASGTQEEYQSRRVSATQDRRSSEEGYSVTRIQVDSEEASGRRSGGYYRQFLQETQQNTQSRKKRNPAAAMIVLFLLVGIIGVAISKNQEAVKDIQTWVSGASKGDSQTTEQQNVQGTDTQTAEEAVSNLESQDTDSQTVAGEAVPSAGSQTTEQEVAPSVESQTIEQESVPSAGSQTAEEIPEIPVEKVDGGIETGN
ncbi:MAG: hypothetical protein J6B26_05210 [Agathobacter sp.]|nr:hypothetical protein [Agathobacter sp.]